MTSVMAKFGATLIGGSSRTGADMSVAQIIADLRRQIVDRKVRVKDFLKEHDRLNTGRVSKPNFKRALQSAGLIVSESNGDKLCSAFEAAYQPDNVDYVRFHDKLDEVFSAKGLEKDPKRRVEAPGVTGRFKYGLSVAPESDSLAEDVVRQVRHVADNMKFVVSDPFRHFDKLNRGSVTAQQFLRVLNMDFHITISDEKASALEARFGANGMINYRQFCEAVGYSDVTSPTHIASAGPKGHAANRRGPSVSRALDDNLDLLYRTMLDRKLDAADALQDYDKLRRGFVTPSQFTSVLAALGLGGSFKTPDLDAIADSFVEPSNGMVRYRRFLEAVERNRVKGSTAHSHQTAPSETLLLRSILSKVNSLAASTRLTMMDSFKDFDRNRNLHVSAAQFDRVLHRNSVLSRISNKELEYLHRHFADSLRGGMINYQAFMNELSALSATNASEATVAAQIRARTPPSRVDVQYVIASIKDRVKKLRIRVADFFYDYDPLRTGFVTENLFTTALETARLQLTGSQMEELSKFYANAEGGTDARGEPFVQYSRFVDELDAMFTQKGLERDPDADVEAFTRTAAAVGDTPNDDSLDPQQRLTTEEEDQLREVLNRVDTYVKRVQQDIVTPFTDFDRSRRGIVTAEQFKRAVKKCLEFLTEADVFVVMKAFQAPDGTGKMGSLDTTANRARYIGYKWFVAAVDNVDGVLGNLPNPADPRMESIPNKTQGAVARHTARPNRVAVVDNVDASVSARDALRKIAQLQVAQRKQVREFMEQYDPLRKGFLTQAKFECALDNAGFQLSRSQQVALEKKYAHFDSRRADMVMYKDLLRDLRQESAAGGGQRAQGNVGADDLSLAVRSSVVRLAHVVRQRRIQCKNSFVARDRLREGTLTPAQFRGVIDSLGLKQHVSDSALEALVKAFKSEKHPSRVDYRRFLQLVDPEE
eukprot:INCI944.1.p1 GENE.INCI944.1~~INCI944.1.p1  ORF type:complete len:935 (+),score=178.76 INCI944.1:259-3063(+)